MYIVQKSLGSLERGHGFAKTDFVVLDGHFGATEVVFLGDVVAIE